MTLSEWIAVCFVFSFAALALFLGIRSFLQRGFLLNNRYLYASKEERQTMDKKPYYRQTAVIFFFISAVNTVIALSVLLDNKRLLWLEAILFIAMIAYALISTVQIDKRAQK